MIRVVHRAPSVRITQMPQALQHEIDNQRDDIDRPVVSEHPQRDQPCRVHGDHQRIMPRRHLDGAAGHHPAGVIM
jgi:hypothetical protein